MYAIIKTGGKQYRVQPGDIVDVERLAGEPGTTLELDHVLLVGGDGVETRVGTPVVPNALVRAEVVGHPRGEKVIVFRFKAKARYRRKTGHRQELTRLRIADIVLDGDSNRRSRTTEAESTPATAREAAPATASSEVTAE